MNLVNNMCKGSIYFILLLSDISICIKNLFISGLDICSSMNYYLQLCTYYDVRYCLE